MIRSFLGDYGIDINDLTFCPRCKQNKLEVNHVKESWYCGSCAWRGQLSEKKIPRMDADEAAPELERWKIKGVPEGKSLGWQDLDPILKVSLGEWSVVTGYASHGKSQFMDAIMVNMADAHGWKFAIFSPENVPYERHVKGLAQKFLGKRFKDASLEEVRLAKLWLKKYIYFVEPVQPTFEAVLAQVAILAKEKQINSFVIDPFNELEHEIPYGMTETQYIARTLIEFRRFCEKWHLHGWIVAHPSKQMAARRDGDDGGKRPIVRLSDISGSAHFENKAFNGISVWRNPMAEGEERHFNHVYVLKVRNSDNGHSGKEVLTWSPDSTRYLGKSEMGHSWAPGDKVKDKMNNLFGDWKKSSLITGVKND